jgi:transcriptional regulator with XRE-family HTH domain
MPSTQRERGSERGPIVLRLLLGAQLRRLRESRGITRQAAGYEIRASESKISRMELGRVRLKERDVSDLLTLYGITNEAERAPMLSQARDANTPGWWQKFADVLPSWFETYVGLETGASLIRTCQLQFVPELLQTEDYARAVIGMDRTTEPADAEEVERRVSLRMTRQQVLARPEPPRLWAVLGEAALRRPTGRTDVTQHQVQRLIEAAKLQNMRIQILTLGSGGHAAGGGAFTILRFPDPDVPDVAYVEQPTAIYLDKRDDVDQYSIAMERSTVQAQPLSSTLEILEGIQRDLEASDPGPGPSGTATGTG